MAQKTLWQMGLERLKKAAKQPAEMQLLNPLEAKIGSFVLLDTIEHVGKHFQVVELDEYTRTIIERNYKFTDYILRDGDEWITLRIDPIPDATLSSPKRYHALVLTQDYECQYDQALHEQVLPQGVMEIQQLSATFRRLCDSTQPYHATVRVLKDPHKPPEIEQYDYWDFVRERPDGATEFYFVEMESKTGYFKMFIGTEVSETQIMTL